MPTSSERKILWWRPHDGANDGIVGMYHVCLVGGDGHVQRIHPFLRRDVDVSPAFNDHPLAAPDVAFLGNAVDRRDAPP